MRHLIYLALFALIVLSPPIIYDYVYPNIGDDSATTFLQVIDEFDRGDMPDFSYLGQIVVAYPTSILGRLTGIDTDVLFLWFNFLVLICIGSSLYVVLGLVNKTARLLAIPIVMFSTQSILAMFLNGTIMHIINVYIVFLLGAFFMIKYLTESKRHQIILSLSLFSVFSILHPSGIYLSAVLIPFLVIYKRQRAWLFSMAIPLGLLLSYTLVPAARALTLQMLTPKASIVPIPTLDNFLVERLGLTTLTILVVSLIGVIIYRKKIHLDTNAKLFVTLITIFAAVMATVTFTGISAEPLRTSTDLATLLAVLATCLAGLVLQADKRRLLSPAIILVTVIGVTATLLGWFGYNSAIRPADLQAIEYLNAQEGQYFNTSTQVAPWIYGRFLTKTHNPDSPDFTIFRDTPMTDRTNPKRIWFLYDSPSRLEDYKHLELLKTFKDGEVTIHVFRHDS